MSSKLCAIISGGDFSPLSGIENSDFVIACDKGLEYALKSGVKPDLFVGDGDSFSGKVPPDIKKLPLPCKKDDTDTLAAVRYALKSGFRDITLYCALGGRLDHTVANIQSAAFAAENGAFVRFCDEKNTLYVTGPRRITLNKRKGCSLSLFSLGDRLCGVTVSGAEYPLENARLTNVFPVGVSNEWKDDVEISFSEGTMLIVLSVIG